ncbi:MAG: helix-turn-helix transcriptional regulator [Bacteroidota bacterium]
MNRKEEAKNTLHIKNMVCNRCIKVVKEELEKLGITVLNISLGEVEVLKPINKQLMEKVKIVLLNNGFELIENQKVKLIETIKKTIIESIYSDNADNNRKKNFSDLIVEKIGRDYHYLSVLFSSQESITIEQYYILQKIERAKELLKYGELTLSEIAYKLNYSSVQHLSNQFKKVTGFSASEFKNLTQNTRKPLDKIAAE